MRSGLGGLRAVSPKGLTITADVVGMRYGGLPSALNPACRAVAPYHLGQPSPMTDIYLNLAKWQAVQLDGLCSNG